MTQQQCCSYSRRSKGRIAALCNSCWNAEEGQQGKQDRVVIFGQRLRIATALVEPSDGVIVSPEDLVNCLQGKIKKKKLTELHRILDGVQEQLMEEWSNE